MSKQYLEERVQRFLDSEVLKGDKEKVLYLRLYNRLRPFKEKKIFSDILAFQFFERDCKEDESYADYFEQDYNRYKVELMLSDPVKLISTWRAEESIEVSEK